MKPLSLIVRTGCNLFAWFMLVFGVNVVVHGYASPGGGFQGGAIVATFIAFLLVSYGGEKIHSWVNEKIYDLILEETGLLLFITLAFMGLPTSFFYNFFTIPWEAYQQTGRLFPQGTTAIMSIAVGIEVAGALSMVILSMFKGIRLVSDRQIEEEPGHDR
ncbi:MAG TPA: sodium:proton antiporter [Synergistaceae bacterium]|jgi:multicomponent Na+:H+ antiporter subunit B|nr:sodium:proton antiporter [Synergistaceae bacterium]